MGKLNYFGVNLKLSNKKTSIEVNSYLLFDLLGDIGGFKEVIVVVVALFGNQISYIFLKAAIAEDNYIYRGSQ